MQLNKKVETKTAVVILLMVFSAASFFFTLPTIIVAIAVWSISKSYLENSDRLLGKPEAFLRFRAMLLASLVIFSVIGFFSGYLLTMKYSSLFQIPILGIFFTGPAGVFVGCLVFFLIFFSLTPKNKL